MRGAALALLERPPTLLPPSLPQAGVWDMLYGNLDEASLAEHGVGGGGAGFAAAGKNHALADPARYPYSAVGALFAYAETARGPGASAGAPAPAAPPGEPRLACTAAMVSPRHALTAASCVSRPHYDLVWTPSTNTSLAAAWGDAEVVPGLYGDCSRGGGARVVRARVPDEWAAWDAASVAASADGRGDAAPDAGAAKAGSALDWNVALLTLAAPPAGASPGFLALPPSSFTVPPRGANLTRVAYGAPDVGRAQPAYSNCPLLDAVAAVGAARGAPPALALGCAMYPATRGAPLWATPLKGVSTRTVVGVQASSLDYWHAYVALDAAAAGAALADVASTLALTEPAAQGMATAVTGAVADRLRAWMAEDGVSAADLAAAGPAPGQAVANPRPPLLGGAKPDDGASNEPKIAPKRRSGKEPTLAALDAADRARRDARVPGASAAASSSVGGARPPAPAPTGCALAAGVPPQAAARDAEKALTAGAGLDDPPLWGRHVRLPAADAALFPFSAIGSLRAYRSPAAAAAAAAAGAPADGGAPRAPPPDRTCGAALVGPRHALTAHHCVFNATGRKARDPATLVFFPAAAAGCAPGEGAAAPARVASLRALPAAQGCLEDLSSDLGVSTDKAATVSACDDVLGSDYALLELAGPPLGDALGFFALGPAPGSSGLAGGTNLTLAGYGALDAAGVRVASLSTCVLLPTDALATARRLGARKAKAGGGGGLAGAPAGAPRAGAGDAGSVLFTGCAVAGGDSGGPLWLPSPASAPLERRLVGVASTVQSVWAVASRVDPSASSGWPKAWAATYGVSDPLQSSAVGIDGRAAERLRGWMVDDGTPKAALARGGKPPPAEVAAAAAAWKAGSPAPAPAADAVAGAGAPAAAPVATASAAVSGDGGTR